MLALIKMVPLKWWGIAALVLALGVQTLRLDFAQSDLRETKSAHAAYAAQVSADNMALKVAVSKREADEAVKKEKADAENVRTVSVLAGHLDRMRRERDDARANFLPPASASAGSKCPDGQVCLDRAEYLGAYRELVQEVRGAGDEGTSAVTDLDTAKKWAQGK
jgi:hypothetical protein